MKLQTPKGFRDFLPADALKRKYIEDKIIRVFAKFGFDPLETPTLEYAETLKGKYGEDEKLIYQFTDRGGDELALRYDQTVPLARVVAQYGPTGQQSLTMPFKRYQIQSSFRGENTQKGRYREFLQCDADIIGSASLVADTEILALVYEIYKEISLEIVIKINDRVLLSDIPSNQLSSIDKLNKIGRDGVLNDLGNRGLTTGDATKLLDRITNLKASENLLNIINFYTSMGYPEDSLVFDPTLVRGLDYYTGLILEVVLKSDQNGSSLSGGGRYDKLISKFSGADLPAVGFSIGLDRTLEAMEEAGILKTPSTNTQALVTVFSIELSQESIKIVQELRKAGINTELWLESQTKLDKQLKYADQKGIPFVIIIGSEEVEKNTLTLKDLKNNSQETLTLKEVISRLKPKSP